MLARDCWRRIASLGAPMARLRFFRRDAEQVSSTLAPAGPADELLGRFLEPTEIIDRYDATYLDDLPAIFAEVHGLTPGNMRGHPRWSDLQELWAATGRAPEDLRIED